MASSSAGDWGQQAKVMAGDVGGLVLTRRLQR